jgi:sodium/hydrogen antiporter
MDNLHTWYLLLGSLLLVLGLIYQRFRHLPVSTSLLYLLAGYLIGGPLGLVKLTPSEHLHALEVLTEVGVLLSLFTAGLKLHMPLGARRWRVPVVLATVSMTLFVAFTGWIGTQLLGLSLGAAVLLGGILAPTDPVLASEVQVRKPGDRHPVRFNLTAEAGINDGAAFPFIFLGLGLLGLHPLGTWGWRWFAADVLWAGLAGLAIGAVCGTVAGHAVVKLRTVFSESVNAEELVGLGLMAFSYGLALWLHAYGFLAVFAAGLGLRRLERRSREDSHEAALARELLHFHESLELLAEAGLVVFLGILCASMPLPWHLWWLPLVLFCVVRPLAVAVSLVPERLTVPETAQIAWFGVRGIGSLYYCAYACNHGLSSEMAEQLLGMTLLVVTASILLHGVSATPLMSHWERKQKQFSGE